MTLQDEMDALLDDLEIAGYSRREMLEEVAELVDGDTRFANEIVSSWEELKDPKNEEATLGDIEDFYEDLVAEGFPEDEILPRMEKKFKLSRRELLNILEL